jgi:hypothetical protein
VWRAPFLTLPRRARGLQGQLFAKTQVPPERQKILSKVRLSAMPLRVAGARTE